jgi:hypothetical protein
MADSKNTRIQWPSQQSVALPPRPTRSVLRTGMLTISAAHSPSPDGRNNPILYLPDLECGKITDNIRLAKHSAGYNTGSPLAQIVALDVPSTLFAPFSTILSNLERPLDTASLGCTDAVHRPRCRSSPRPTIALGTRAAHRRPRCPGSHDLPRTSLRRSRVRRWDRLGSSRPSPNNALSPTCRLLSMAPAARCPSLSSPRSAS